MKLNPDKFSQKDFELITKLYLEMETSLLNVKYFTLKENLSKVPNLKKVLLEIENQNKQLNKEIKNLESNLKEKINEDYIFYRNLQKIFVNKPKLKAVQNINI